MPGNDIQFTGPTEAKPLGFGGKAMQFVRDNPALVAGLAFLVGSALNLTSGIVRDNEPRIFYACWAMIFNQGPMLWHGMDEFLHKRAPASSERNTGLLTSEAGRVPQEPPAGSANVENNLVAHDPRFGRIKLSANGLAESEHLETAARRVSDWMHKGANRLKIAEYSNIIRSCMTMFASFFDENRGFRPFELTRGLQSGGSSVILLQGLRNEKDPATMVYKIAKACLDGVNKGLEKANKLANRVSGGKFADKWETDFAGLCSAILLPMPLTTFFDGVTSKDWYTTGVAFTTLIATTTLRYYKKYAQQEKEAAPNR